jgi:hypothetical protein
MVEILGTTSIFMLQSVIYSCVIVSVTYSVSSTSYGLVYDAQNEK